MAETKLIQNKDLYEKEYHITSFLTNTRGKLGLYALLNLLQDVAHFHANILGLGYEQMVAKKTFWVLTRQKLVMNKWPKWEDCIHIKTWVRLSASAFTNRDFAIYLNGEKSGEATTSWMTLDADTRRPKSVDHKELFANLNHPEKIDIEDEKIVPEKTEQTTLAEFKVRNSDIDQNNHVNNTKYAQWILDAIPFQAHHEHDLESYSINFVAEAKLSDIVKIQNGPRKNEQQNSFETQFQGVREADSKVVFVAKLGAKKI